MSAAYLADTSTTIGSVKVSSAVYQPEITFHILPSHCHVATVTQFTTMMSFVRAGVGIAIVPFGAIAGLLGKDLAVLKLIRPRLSRDVGLIWLPERELTPAASIPSAAIITTEFVRETELTRRALGMPDFEPIVIDHPVSSITQSEINARVCQIKEQAKKIWIAN